MSIQIEYVTMYYSPTFQQPNILIKYVGGEEVYKLPTVHGGLETAIECLEKMYRVLLPMEESELDTSYGGHWIQVWKNPTMNLEN